MNPLIKPQYTGLRKKVMFLKHIRHKKVPNNGIRTYTRGLHQSLSFASP